ncbi:MAG: NAD-dependent protein deacylase [Dehalococcoidia bacterium]
MSTASTDYNPHDADPHADAIARAAEILLRSRYCIALTGAGISAESGIPTFRGKDGLWTKQGEPPLNQYQQFQRDPATWWRGVKQRRENPDELAAALREAVPNDGHFAMSELERIGVLKHTITQNVDGLHRLAGSEQLTEIHGNTRMLRCTECNSRHPFEEVPEILPPRCDHCGGMVKTDTVMFGEPIPRDALLACMEEAKRADCMLLVGTTAVVSPAADFAWEVRSGGNPLIEVNLDPTVISDHCEVAIHAQAGEIMPRIVDLVKRGLVKREQPQRGSP